MRADEPHPQAQAFIERQRRLGLTPLPKRYPRLLRLFMRGLAHLQNRNPPPVGKTVDHAIPGPDGDLPVRIYQPDGSGPFPTIVFFHGGGWVFGGLATHDPLCRRLTRATGAVVVAVDYRLAPEHPFPAAVEDAYAATEWAATHGEDLASDGTLAVVGDSAGGQLAAVVALMARDRDGPALDYQALLYPGIGFREGQDSLAENAGLVLHESDIDWFVDCYFGSEVHRRNPYADPTRACDRSGLPPATVVTAGYDPLRDGGTLYADQLSEAGVAVTHRNYPDMIHGFATSPEIDRSREVVADIATDLRDALGGS